MKQKSLHMLANPPTSEDSLYVSCSPLGRIGRPHRPFAVGRAQIYLTQQYYDILFSSSFSQATCPSTTRKATFHRFLLYSTNTILKQLLRISLPEMSERATSLKKLFELAATKHNMPQIKEMKFNTEDRGCEDPKDKQYSVAYNKTIPSLKRFCGPDPFFVDWPSANIHSFEEVKQQIIAEGLKPPTIQKIGWYGNIYSAKSDVIESQTRPLLKKIGDANPHLFDIHHVAPNNDQINNSCANYMSLPDLVKYRYLIDIGGNGWSGRVKFLLFSRRPLLLVDRKYIDYFFDDLIPYVHYIPVKEDLSDLQQQIKWLLTNNEQALQIAQNAYNYAVHNLTEAKVYERIAEVYKNLNTSN